MWVDTCISVPTLGLLTTPSFNAVFHYPERLQPLLDEAVVRDQELGVVGDRTLGFEFQTKLGFTYRLNVNNIVVEFDYRPTETRAPGALPGRIRADIGAVPAAPVKKLPAFSQRHPEHRPDVHAWLQLSAGVFNVHPDIHGAGISLDRWRNEGDRPHEGLAGIRFAGHFHHLAFLDDAHVSLEDLGLHPDEGKVAKEVKLGSLAHVLACQHVLRKHRAAHG